MLKTTKTSQTGNQTGTIVPVITKKRKNRKMLLPNCGSNVDAITPVADLSELETATTYVTYGELLNGINTKGRPVAAIDWALHEIWVAEKGKPTRKFNSMEEVIQAYKGYILAYEATMASYDLKQRGTIIKAFEENNIIGYCMNSRETARFRDKHDIEKSDKEDAETILRIFLETPINFCKFKALHGEDPMRDRIKKWLVPDRRDKTDIAKRHIMAQKFMPSFAETPKELLPFLYSSGVLKLKKAPKEEPKHREQIGRFLYIATEVRKAGRGYREFRNQIGNFQNGYPCMPRSEFYYWWCRPIIAARVKAEGIKVVRKTRVGHVNKATAKENQVRVWSPRELEIKKQVLREADKVLKYLWKLTVSESASEELPTS